MTFTNSITIVIAVLSAAWILWLIRRQRLSVYTTLWWLFVALSLLFFGLFPSIIDRLGHMFGVNYPPVLVIVVALCVIVVKLVSVDIERTNHDVKIRILAQKMAAYEAELSKLKAELCKKKQRIDED